MLPFFLYSLAGAITGVHLLLLIGTRVPLHPLQYVSLAGSLFLIVAAYLSLFRPYVAARVALLASLAIWSFYSPAIARVIESRIHQKRVELPLTRSMYVDIGVLVPNVCECTGRITFGDNLTAIPFTLSAAPEPR